MNASFGLNGRSSSHQLVAMAIVALAACSEATTEPSVGGLSVVQAPPTKATPGWILRDTMTVRVVSAAGRPRSGALVTWAVTTSGGLISPIRDTTDAHGLAMAVWTLGPQAGPTEVTARASDMFAVTLSTVAEAFRADQLAASLFLGCGLVNGEVWCWGKDAWTSTEPVSLRPSPGPGWYTTGAPGPVPGPAGFATLAVAYQSVCALDAAGSVWCASPSAPALAQRADLPPLRQVVGASWGGSRYCGLAAADSTAWCWRLTEGAAVVPASPAFVGLDIDGDDTGGPYVGFLACGTLIDSTTACWGSGSLGDGLGAASATPVAVTGGHRFAEVAVGEMFACGRQADGELWCWGRNTQGQLGVPGPDAPTPVHSASGITRVTASGGTVLARQSGVLIYWGGWGWLTPRPVASLAGLDVTQFAASSADCVSLADNQIHCVDEMWDHSSNFAIQAYAPVHPVVAGAP